MDKSCSGRWAGQGGVPGEGLGAEIKRLRGASYEANWMKGRENPNWEVSKDGEAAGRPVRRKDRAQDGHG